MSDPYYPWYPGDYLRDTLDLSMLEDGAYRRLLDCYFLADGNLPADPKKLYKICRAMTKSEQKAIQNVAKKYFVESNNRIHNNRADQELIKRRKFLENQRIKSKLGVLARQPVGKPVDIPVGKPGGQPLLSPSPSLSSSSSPKERKTLAHFEQFWNAYPKKKNKGQAEKVWSKLKPDQDLLKTILKKIEQAKQSKEWIKDNGQYIPYPATWLNAKGWEDEITEEKSSCQYI